MRGKDMKTMILDEKTVLTSPCVATIGFFDGVHLGHQAILRHLRQKANALNLPMAVMLFEPQPREYFMGDKAPARLMRLRDSYII